SDGELSVVQVPPASHKHVHECRGMIWTQKWNRIVQRSCGRQTVRSNPFLGRTRRKIPSPNFLP
ncbi:hypothetical protein L0222_03355, partial [bacterium]|nr:hypothetical protein [bacterium]